MSKRRKRRNQMLTMFMMDKRYNVLYRLSLIIILNISIIVFIDCNLLRDFSMASPPVAEQSSRKCNQPASGIRGGMGGGSGGGGGGGHHDQSNDHGGHGGGHGHSRHHSRTHNNNTNSNSNGGGDHRPNSGTQSWPGHSLSSNSSWNSLKNRHGNSNNHVGKGSNNNHGNSNSHNGKNNNNNHGNSNNNNNNNHIGKGSNSNNNRGNSNNNNNNRQNGGNQYELTTESATTTEISDDIERFLVGRRRRKRNALWLNPSLYYNRGIGPSLNGMGNNHNHEDEDEEQDEDEDHEDERSEERL